MRKAIALVEIIVIISIIGIIVTLLYSGVTRAIENEKVQSQLIQTLGNGTTIYSYYGDEVKYIETTVGDKQYTIFIASHSGNIDIEVLEIME